MFNEAYWKQSQVRWGRFYADRPSFLHHILLLLKSKGLIGKTIHLQQICHNVKILIFEAACPRVKAS